MPVEIIVRPTLGSYVARAKGNNVTASRSEGARQAAEALVRKLDLGAGKLQQQPSVSLPRGQQRFAFISDGEMTECQFHNNCGGWCETPPELEHNLCEHCLEAHDEEMARLPVQHNGEQTPSADPLSERTEYPPCDYCGSVPGYHPWHGSGMINGVENRHIHACDECRVQLPPHPGQHQGEPVLWRYRKTPARNWFYTVQKRSAEIALRDGYIVEEFYTRADPGEVERLRKELLRWKGVAETVQVDAEKLADESIDFMSRAKRSEAEVERLREDLRLERARSELLNDARVKAEELQWSAERKLAKRDAMLASAYSDIEQAGTRLGQCVSCGELPEDDDIITHDPSCTWCAIEMALCARVEPSAPVEHDERAEFEAYALDKGWLPHQLKQRSDGNYEDWGVNPEWQAWKARAALERKP